MRVVVGAVVAVAAADEVVGAVAGFAVAAADVVDVAGAGVVCERVRGIVVACRSHCCWCRCYCLVRTLLLVLVMIVPRCRCGGKQDYSYLLDLPIHSFTSEKLSRLEADLTTLNRNPLEPTDKTAVN